MRSTFGFPATTLLQQRLKKELKELLMIKPAPESASGT
jgi:hypothetical protein